MACSSSVKVIPITDKQVDYAKNVVRLLENENVRVELDDRSEKIGYKIREAQLQKIPYMLIVGDKEIEANAVGVRSRKDGDIGQIPTSEFIQKIKNEIDNFEK